jgi:hypothetical protein
MYVCLSLYESNESIQQDVFLVFFPQIKRMRIFCETMVDYFSFIAP